MSSTNAQFGDDDLRFQQLKEDAAYFADSRKSKSTSGVNLEIVIHKGVRKIIASKGFPAQIYSDNRTLTTWTPELYEDVTQDVVLDLIKREQFAYIADHAVHIGGLFNILISRQKLLKEPDRSALEQYLRLLHLA